MTQREREKQGISSRQKEILERLFIYTGPLTELAAELKISSAALSRHISNLERKGLVVRHRGESDPDRRVTEVLLTHRGKEVLQAIPLQEAQPLFANPPSQQEKPIRRITVRQREILERLSTHTGPLTELATELKISAPSLNTHLDYLEHKGLIRRRRGESDLDRRVTEVLLTSQGEKLLQHPHFQNPAQSPHDLERHEQDVLRMIAQGRSNQEIADTMELSVKTVRNRIPSILRAIHAASRAEAAVIARNAGLE